MQKVLLMALVCVLAACTKQPQNEAATPVASVPQDVAASDPPRRAQESSADKFRKLEAGAMTGDYQDQRNLAYWLSGGYDGEPPLNPVLACAWRLVILKMGDPQVDASDVSNKKLYCDRKLDADGQAAAEAQASRLVARIRTGQR